MTWLLHVLGVDSATGRWYAWWSGAGSDVGEAAVIGWLFAFLRKHNCEVHGCWRLGRHATAAGHMLCRHHHPDGPLTAGQARDAHCAALQTIESEAR